ncbi:unnamed protein product [Caenorhabditis brenneri]
MAKTVDKVIVNAENGVEDEFLLKDEPMGIKITQVTVKNALMPTNQVEELKTHINNSVALADACLEIAKPLHVAEFQNNLNAIQGVGNIITGIVKFVDSGAPDPVVEKLKELDKKVEKLGEKMNENFVEMKSFITEVKFFINIMSPASTLVNCFRDCINHPGPEAVSNFKKAYKKHSPLELAYKLMSYLEKKTTNPLHMAMETEKAKTKKTFEKWVKIFSRTLGQFLFLEAFANGIHGIKNDYTTKLLISRAAEVLVTINQWKKEYEKDEHYWDEVKIFFEKYINDPNSTKLTNAQKAKEIATKLDTYLTSDSFHVCFFNVATIYDYNYHCANEETQLLKSFLNIGQCNAFIYRSKKFNEMVDDDFKTVRESIEKLRDKKLKLDIYNPMPTMIKQQLIGKNLVREDGLIFICQENRNPFIEIANCGERWKGPGSWELVYLDVGITTIDESLIKKTMLVSFP